MTTLEACEITRPPAADRLKDRVAVFAPCAREVVTTIGRSLPSRVGRRDGDALDARLPCADACHSVMERVQAVKRREER